MRRMRKRRVKRQAWKEVKSFISEKLEDVRQNKRWLVNIRRWIKVYKSILLVFQ